MTPEEYVALNFKSKMDAQLREALIGIHSGPTIAEHLGIEVPEQPEPSAETLSNYEVINRLAHNCDGDNCDSDHHGHNGTPDL